MLFDSNAPYASAAVAAVAAADAAAVHVCVRWRLFVWSMMLPECEWSPSSKDPGVDPRPKRSPTSSINYNRRLVH